MNEPYRGGLKVSVRLVSSPDYRRELIVLLLPNSKGYLHYLACGLASHSLFSTCFHHNMAFFLLCPCITLIRTLEITLT